MTERAGVRATGRSCRRERICSPEKRTDAARAGKRTGLDGEQAGDTAGGDGAPAGGANLCGELPPGQYRVKKAFQAYRAPGDYDVREYYAEFTIR